MSYDSELSNVLASRDWQALREFTRKHNDIPDEVYQKDQHFWEVLMHKLTANRIDTLAYQEQSREWLQAHGYTTDIGGY